MNRYLAGAAVVMLLLGFFVTGDGVASLNASTCPPAGCATQTSTSTTIASTGPGATTTSTGLTVSTATTTTTQITTSIGPQTTVIGTQTATQTTVTNSQPSGIVISYVYPATFTGGGQVGYQITVAQGTQVSVTVTLQSSQQTTGTLDVQIKADLIDWPDTVVSDFQQTVTLAQGTTVVTAGPFTASYVSGQGGLFGIATFMEYFVKVLWNGVAIYDPTNTATREWVKTYACSTCATTTTTTSSPTTTTTTTVQQSYQTAITAASGSTPLNAPITVNGASYTTPVTITTYLGQAYTVNCGQVSGYNSLTPTITFTQAGGSVATTSVVCQYAPSTATTTTLTITVRIYSATLRTYFPGVGDNVVLNNGQVATTNSNGVATFTVPVNAQYTATDPYENAAYGYTSVTVNVGTSPASGTLTYATGGLSSVRLSILSQYTGLPLFGVSEIAAGLVLLAFGILLALGAEVSKD